MRDNKDEGLRVMFVPWKIFGGKSGKKNSRPRCSKGGSLRGEPRVHQSDKDIIS